MSAVAPLPRGAGPFDDVPWPRQLTARVVDGASAPQLHGYDVQGDLARHYRLTEIVFLALTGELPASPSVSAALDVALAFLAVARPAEAPTHAAIVARTCSASTSAILGTAAIALAEQARSLVEEHAELLAWLDASHGASTDPPRACLAADDGDRQAVARLRAALARSGIAVPLLAHEPSLDAALFAVLHACGLRGADALEAVIVSARLPVATAEALAHPPMGFKEYPMNLPPFEYVEEP